MLAVERMLAIVERAIGDRRQADLF
jgi:hypothetical protein